MSGFEEYKKISKNEPIIVNNNNAQKQINDMNGLLEQERDKGVEINKSPYDYDPDQLLEHFRQRTADDTDEAFNLRTKYYFQDEDYMTAKARRYQKINQRGENRGKLDEYSQRYSYHKAKNRQYAAETASIKFADARDKQQRYKNDGAADSLTQYKHRKEIMKDRMAALESVAYVKAKDKKHEKYLIGRSRLSGNLILKDQLDHFIAKETHDPQNVNHQMVRDLNRELAKVESEIKKATKIVVDNVPKAQDKWRDANRLNNAQYTRSMNAYREELNPGCEKNSAILMTEFTLLETQVRSLAWPKKSVLTLGEGSNAVPISKAEKENRDWNAAYDNANDEQKLQMQREALERFKGMPLPSANAIKNSGARKYIITNLRNYYDLTKRALPYYKRLLDNPGNDPFGLEIQNDAALRARITYLDAIDRYINYRLRRDHQIVYGQNGFGFETDPQYRYNRDPRGRVRRQRKYGTGADGRSQSNAEFTLLSNAFTAFQAAMRGEGAAQNNPPQQPVQVQGGIIQNQEIHNVEEINANNPVNIIINEEQFNQPGPEDIIVAKNTVKNIVNLFENKGKNNKNIINENNNNIINVEEDVKENLNKINVIKEDAKENLNKINVIIEDKKEDVKEDIKNKINILENKKEVKKGAKKEDKKKDAKKHPEFLYKEEKGRIYMLTPEQEKQYKAFHKKQKLITRRIYNVKVVHQKTGGLIHIPEYKKLFENCSDQIRSNGQNNAASTIDRDVQIMLKPVLLDSKGNPVTETDKINHQWNKDFFNCWQKDKVDEVKAEKMIAEYLPHVYDEADEVLTVLKENSKDGKTLQAAMEDYFERLLNDEKALQAFYHMKHIGLSLDNMRRKLPSVGNFTSNNKKFNYIGDVLGQVSNLFETYLITKYGIDVIRDGIDYVYKGNDLKSKQESYAGTTEDLYKFVIEQYQEHKNEFDKKTNYDFYAKEEKNTEVKKEKNKNVINENVINENKINENVINENKIIEKKAKVSGVNKAYVSEDTIAEYKKIYPELSDDAIKIIKGYKHVVGMKYNPEYIELVKKGGKGLAGGAASASIDRVASYIMRPVEFDENSVPVKTKENLANHEWNLKWLKSWEEIKDYTQEEAKAKKAEKTGKKINKVKLTQEELNEIEAENEKRRQRREENQKIRKAMIEEESKKMWEGFELPPIPESEELTEKDVLEYRKKLDKWIDEHVTKDPVKYYTLLFKFPAMDRLYKQSDDLKRVFKREPARHQLEKFVSDVNNYVIFYLQTKYHVDIEQSGLGVIIKPGAFANYEKAVGSMINIVAQSSAESGLAYKKMRDESKFVSVDVTQLKKMHEGNAIIADAKKDIELKKEIAGNLTETIEAVNNEKIALRRKVDIKDKKKLDFKTFEKLSQFGTLFGNNADLAKYCALYGEGMKKQKVSKDKSAGNKEIFEVMEKLTGVIDKFDLKDINVSTDEYLMLHASELEKMSGAVYAYNDLLMQNPDYLEKLKKDKAIDEKAFPNRAEEVVDKVVKLSAVADYYRARKLVITDELYTSKLNSQISYQSTKEDGTQMRRLKKLMRASYVAALNLGRVFGEKIPKQPDVQPESEDEKAIFDNLYRDAEKVETEKKERIEKEKQQKDSKNKNEIIEEDKKLKNKLDINMDIKDSMLAKLDALLVRDKQIKRLENERLFQAPLWMQNALTLDPKKIPDKLQTKGVKNPFFAIDNEKFGLQRLHLHLQDPKTKSLDEKRKAVIKEMTGSESYLSSPRFVNDDVKYLNTIDVSDSWNRTVVAFATEYMYGKCEEEMVELTELMKIQESKLWKDEKGNEHSKDWDKIKEDKDAFEFYKSAFIELSKKLFYSVYASAKRAAETYGLKALILHPTDLITQMTYELRKNITATSVITNIVDNRNTKGKSRQDTVKQLFDDFDDGTYNLDIEDFINVSGLVASLGLKINSTTQGIVDTARGDDDDIEGIEEKNKAIFGNADFFNKVVEPEYNKYIKEHKLINGKVDGIFSLNDQNQMVAWFLNHHPEYINRKALNAKYGEEGALQQFVSDAYTSPFANNEYDILQSIKKKSIDVPSQKELDNYEKHLVKEKYPKARTKYESSSGLVLKSNDKLRVEDVKGNVIGMETNKLKLDAREKDPYGVKLFKTEFSELNYVDKQGKKHFRVGV